MDDFKEGDTIEVVEGIRGGHFGDYYTGDTGKVLSVLDGTLKIDFGGKRIFYTVLKSEVRSITSSNPVMQRIKLMHSRQKSYPYLTKEYVTNA